ncbi:hypothetical protein [Vulcaniibacterium tengchongense]|uniref:DUF930 domain-containing protein n=1 Tax=Vulcaniibacterium tengchongense TaxID=1273429 RepID=A0A3N4VSC3_9GAMM|nr:hypothetical protein [Vulcaniibacterium tengchongense]RPE79977.1 hypothetical protein EDC50_1807 [Vulcaniibacterium tengchongense]
MPQVHGSRCTRLAAAAALATAAAAAFAAEPALSPAQQAAVDRRIAALRDPQERELARGWSNAKKVAEAICRPLALPALRKQVKGADRVFLGSDDPATLTLESDRLLRGRGQLRAGDAWRQFAFRCRLDPGTGRATAFAATLD